MIIPGDLTRRKGTESKSKVVGQHGKDIVNYAGSRLIEVCKTTVLLTVSINDDYSKVPSARGMIHTFTQESVKVYNVYNRRYNVKQ